MLQNLCKIISVLALSGMLVATVGPKLAAAESGEAPRPPAEPSTETRAGAAENAADAEAAAGAEAGAETRAPVAMSLARPRSADQRSRRWIGRYSGEPLPRYASLKVDRVHFRIGPSHNHAIAWELRRSGLPVRVIGEYANWRRVQLFNGDEGWIHRVLLSGDRTAVAAEAFVRLHQRPDAGSHGIVEVGEALPMRLLRCQLDWCEVTVDGRRGWAQKTALWGVDASDVFD